MKVLCKNASIKGSVKIPPSKSMAHRAIICASLANGTSTISNIAYSKDIIATIEAMKLLGATIIQKDDSLIIHGSTSFQPLSNEVFCNESGSTLRFLIPIFSLCHNDITFTGAGRLMERPQDVYATLFHERNLTFIQNKNGIQIKEALIPGTYQVAGDVSSQFISGLLFTLPLLKEDSIIKIQPPFESSSYVALTIQMLEKYGIHIEQKDDVTFYIPGNQSYQPFDYEVEGDYSQLAFFGVWAAINGECEISGVDPFSKQGDKVVIDILKQYGAHVEERERGYCIRKNKLKATTIDLANCPDLGPILCVLGMYAQGESHIIHASRLRMKESDRIEAMELELRKLGCDITSSEDEIIIKGKHNKFYVEPLCGHNDHRIVMALSVAIACGQNEAIIEDAQAITKSYPNYFEDYIQVHGKVEYL